MTAHARSLDSAALHRAVNQRRTELGISWREVSRQAGLATVGLGYRLAKGDGLSADSLIRILAWLGTNDVGPFTRDAT